MKRPSLPLAAVLLAATLAAVPVATPLRAQDASPSPSTANPAATVQDIRVTLHTSKGDIEGTLYAKHSPVAVANYLQLAGKKFYDGLKFHRVIPNFMIQGGDPEGTGGGGPGYTIDDEANKDLHFDKPGVFAMANRGANTSGSQFFITHGKTPWLEDNTGNGHYTIFGQVTKGQDVVDRITQGDRIDSIDVHDSTQALFSAQAKLLDEWNTKMAKAKEKK